MTASVPPPASDRARHAPRGLGTRALFALVYTTSVSSVYFALGVIAHRALGLTPLVFLVAGVFFALTSMTYVEGAALHRERGGSSTFARYAFNELVSFVAGWAILLDYAILVAVTAFAASSYLAELWSPLGDGPLEPLVAIAIIAGVAAWNVRGVSMRQLQRHAVVALADLGVQLLLIVLGIALVLDPGPVLDAIDLGVAPTIVDLVSALVLATIAFTGLEAAASLAGEVRASDRELRRLVGPGAAAIVLVYVGIAVVAVGALPVSEGAGAFDRRDIEAPLLAIASAFDPAWLADALRALVAVAATVALVAAANGAMLGTSRLGYALATNRQIPSALGRLHPRHGTPVVLIGAAATLAAALTIPGDLEMLVAIYAFGALIAFTIAHASVIALRVRESQRERRYRIPGNVRLRGVAIPLPAAIGGLLSAGGWVTLVVVHDAARWVGLGWLAVGLVVYVVYRRLDGNPLLRRVTVPEQALRADREEDKAFGSILVPLLDTPLDDDIVQTAGRLAGGDERGRGATIEAVWVFEVPMALPIDAPLPEEQVLRAHRALRRAQAIGQEYEGVEVRTAMIRARRAGQGIVAEARRRGVEAIVLAADEPPRVRGGALLGGVGGPLDNVVGEVTTYVVRKAPCRVILTAPAAEGRTASGDGDGAPRRRPQGADDAGTFRRRGPGRAR